MMFAGMFSGNGKIFPVTPMGSSAKAIVGAVMAVLCGGIGTVMLLRYFGAGRHCKTEVEAEIMHIDKSTNKKHGQTVPVYAPVYSYHYNGQHYTFQSNFYTEKQPEIGEKVTLRIDADEPTRCLDGRGRSKSSLLLGLVLELLAAVGVLLFLSIFD